MLLHAVEQSLRWIGKWPEPLDFCKSGVDVAVSDAMHVRGSQARSPAYTFAAMEEHCSATDVSSNGVHDCIELTCRDRLCILDGNVNVTNVPPLGGYAPFAQRNDCGDTVRVRDGQFFCVSAAPEPQSFPNVGHWVSSLSRFFLLRVLSSSQVTIAGSVVCFITMERPVCQSISTYSTG